MQAANPNTSGGDAAGSGLMLAFAILMSFLVHGIFFVLFLASAESIKVLLDIQNNTHQTSYYAQFMKSSKTIQIPPVR